ncbi:hypothetical protein JX265_004244 [Neoarthrinium moseri]|uniref:Uncharacterized protein n=1 Tax=Neoarthrinium moseri TaxID=1658444 RepID=A0A9P9WQT0_9PEZI|nr:hypothetical protein JX265_004244 [Neoarthrinium moseri]
MTDRDTTFNFVYHIERTNWLFPHLVSVDDALMVWHPETGCSAAVEIAPAHVNRPLVIDAKHNPERCTCSDYLVACARSMERRSAARSPEDRANYRALRRLRHSVVANIVMDHLSAAEQRRAGSRAWFLRGAGRWSDAISYMLKMKEEMGLPFPLSQAVFRVDIEVVDSSGRFFRPRGIPVVRAQDILTTLQISVTDVEIILLSRLAAQVFAVISVHLFADAEPSTEAHQG